MATSDITRRTAEAWKAICRDLVTTEERQYGSPQLATRTGTNDPTAGRFMRFFRGLGILKYRSEYSDKKSGGQKVYMQLAAPLDEGLTAIYKHFDAGRSFSWFENGSPGYAGKGVEAPKTEKVVVADERSPGVVRAIAGPEPEQPMAALAPLRKDDAEALIEAARQYANRSTEVSKHIEALRSLGVEVDVTKVMEGVKMTVDPTLETIMVILPVIDRLQSSNERLRGLASGADAALRESRNMAETLRKERDALKAANTRLSERIVKERAAEVNARVEAQA